MSVRSAVLLVPVLCGALRAQSLLVTTAGVVPARDDSIYALRVDPANYRGQDEVFLLEDGIVRVEADGRYSYTLRQVVQLLTPDGVEGWGELAFWHTPDRQRVRINWIRVVGEDGSIVRDGPAHQQEATPPVEPGAPVFSDRRAIQVTLGGLAPGTLVDYSYTLETVRPSVPGDFLFSWYVNGSAPVRRSRFTFDTPPDLNAQVQVRNLGGAAHDTVVAGRRQRRWAIADIPEIVWQRYAGTPNGVVASIRVAGDVSWRTVGAWYDSLARDRYELTSEILAAHARELRGATTLHDSLRATYRWVAQDFRYVSLSLGDGGYQPRAPRDVFQTRFGDCKDKTTLFVSLARHMGLVAYPVLVNSDGRVDSLLPSVKQFDHMIAAVVRGGQHEYLDVTSPLTPYGEVPSALQAEVGLALPREGPRVVVLPAAPAERNRYDVDVVGSFGRDGRLIGRVTVSARGTEEYDLREEFAGFDQQDAKARDETLREYAHSIYAAAVVDSARYADGRDLTTPPGVTVWFTVPKVIGQMGAKYYFNLPLSRFSDPDALTQLDAEGPRRFPIDIASVNSPSVYRSAIEFELPEGWKAELPPPVSVAGPFGYYRAEYRQTGRTLRASREMGGLRGLVPPDSMAALRAWLRAVGEDRTAMIVLDRGTGLDLAADGAVEGSTDGVGALPDVVLRLADLSGGAKVVQEGEAAPSTGLLLAFSSTRPLESYHRAFGAEQMVFSAGGSRLAALQVTAAAYHTAAEAHRSLDLLGLFDLRSFLQLYVQQMGAEQASLGATRALALDSIGDRAAGWVLEFVTPMATLDMAMVFTARGRIGTAVLAVGPKGLQDDDLSALLRTVDDRVRAHATYLTDADGEALGTGDIAAADSALAAATDVALHTIPVPPPDTAALTVKTATFARVNGWPQYALRVNGKGFRFPFGSSSAIGVAMTVTLHETEAQALKEVMAAERSDRTHFMRAVMSEMGELAGMADSVLGGDSTRIEAVTAPRIGARSSAGRAMLRGVFRLDLDAVVFARGRLSASVVVTHEPGGSDPPAAASVARDMLERMRRIAPTASEATPAPALLAAVGRVVDAEHVVDSLVEARDFAGAFRAIERARLSRAPVGFAANTWNSLCWYASLYGHATRAIPACEAAVAPDTTNLAFRDSRGLGRALAGDLAGARVDFEYVVANTDGPFHDERAAWLETLRAGTNPFTPDVLERLKRE
jgi:transglutaminase-like putative cysteine protease